MNSSNYRFTLNMHTVQSQISIPVMLGDTGRTLRISLSDGGNPYVIADGCLAKISIKRPTGTSLEDFCTIERNTTIVYPFSENTCATEGIHDCDVTLYGVDGNIITSPRFSMVVSERVVKSDDIVITDKDQTAVDAMLAKETERQAAETERVANEEERKANAEAFFKMVEGGTEAGLIAYLDRRITTLEENATSGDVSAKGTLYIYKALKDEILDWGDENYFYIEVNGEHIELDAAFFNSCLYLDFGGTSAEAGVYVYPYEGTLKLNIYEAVDISVNGELVSEGEHYTATFTAPQDAHVTLA